MNKPNLMYLPVSLFGSVMGLSGISVAYTQFSIYYPSFTPLVKIFDIFTIFVFIMLIIAYLSKIIFSYEHAKNEFQNPLTKSFFGTISISFLLIPLIINKYHHMTAYIIWLMGVIGTLCFAIYSVYFWIETKHDKKSLTPAWISPVVGTLDIPLAAHLFPEYNYIPYINIMALAIGLFFAIPLLTLIFSRVIFVEKLPYKLMPTLMILIAPFSIGHLAYVMTTGHFDVFALGLFFLGIFLFLSLLPQLFKITKVCPFKVSWWAISFPIAGMINSMFSVALHLDSILFFNVTSAVLLSFTLVIFYLIYRTARGIMALDFYPLV